MHCYNARVRLALTATPGKEGQYSRELLEAVTGKIIYVKTSSDLIKQDFLTKPEIYIYPVIIENRYAKWIHAYNYEILDNEQRNKLIVHIARILANRGKRVLIVVDKIQRHGEKLMNLLKDGAESMYGSHSSKTRKKIFNRFKSGENKILVSTVIKEGVDIPEMDAIILANAGKGGPSGRKTVQTLGRCLRKSKDKERAIIVDFFDQDGGILERHSKQRIKIYKSEPEFEIKLKGVIENGIE